MEARYTSVQGAPNMDLAEFLRVQAMRAKGLGWLLGAGVSAAAGIPTATDMTWSFKRLLYCSEQRKPIAFCSDLGDPMLRERLQRYFDQKKKFPHLGADDEYAVYFEAAYGAESDRRRYIDDCVRDARPSYGHLALGALMAADRARLVWTTNFDRLTEDAGASAFGGSGRQMVASPDTADVAFTALKEDRWPLLGKLHGDFQSTRLRNTTEELRRQDERLRAALLESCRRFGLIVAGYSGRDSSIMDVLDEAVAEGRGFPSGLFWLNRAGGATLPRVQALIARASAAGITAHEVTISTFDELMMDIVKMTELPAALAERLSPRGRFRSAAPMLRAKRGFPVLRLNALRLDPAPASCRRVQCSIGGVAEVREAIKTTGANCIAMRSRAGVLAFGRDADVRAAFASFDVSSFDLHAISSHRLKYESAEHSLLQQAIAAALSRERPLLVDQRRPGYVARIDPVRAGEKLLEPLRAVVKGELHGKLANGVHWAEAVRLRLEHRRSALWLLFEPTVWVERAQRAEDQEVAAEFVRQRLAGRYNSLANALFEKWAGVLAGGTEVGEVRAFGIGDGVDAAFSIHATTAFASPNDEAHRGARAQKVGGAR